MATSQNQRLNEILAGYLESERSGQELDRQRLLAENPDLADELRAFFSDHDRMNAVAERTAKSLHRTGKDNLNRCGNSPRR